MNEILLVGSGGHAAVVLDALLLSWAGCRVEVWDEAEAKDGELLLGISIRAPLHLSRERPSRFHVAIGDNRSRERLNKVLQGEGRDPFSIIHPMASVASSSEIGEASFIAAQGVVGPKGRIGQAAIINHGAIVDHDCRVGSWTHICPNATLGGDVTVGEGVLVGAGATILPGCRIGAWAIVGGGALVCRDVAAGATVVGVPAREVGKR